MARFESVKAIGVPPVLLEVLADDGVTLTGYEVDAAGARVLRSGRPRLHLFAVADLYRSRRVLVAGQLRWCPSGAALAA